MILVYVDCLVIEARASRSLSLLVFAVNTAQDPSKLPGRPRCLYTSML